MLQILAIVAQNKYKIICLMDIRKAGKGKNYNDNLMMYIVGYKKT